MFCIPEDDPKTCRECREVDECDIRAGLWRKHFAAGAEDPGDLADSNAEDCSFFVSCAHRRS